MEVRLKDAVDWKAELDEKIVQTQNSLAASTRQSEANKEDYVQRVEALLDSFASYKTDPASPPSTLKWGKSAAVPQPAGADAPAGSWKAELNEKLAQPQKPAIKVRATTQHKKSAPIKVRARSRSPESTEQQSLTLPVETSPATSVAEGGAAAGDRTKLSGSAAFKARQQIGLDEARQIKAAAGSQSTSPFKDVLDNLLSTPAPSSTSTEESRGPLLRGLYSQLETLQNELLSQPRAVRSKDTHRRQQIKEIELLIEQENRKRGIGRSSSAAIPHTPTVAVQDAQPAAAAAPGAPMNLFTAQRDDDSSSDIDEETPMNSPVGRRVRANVPVTRPVSATPPQSMSPDEEAKFAAYMKASGSTRT